MAASIHMILKKPNKVCILRTGFFDILKSVRYLHELDIF